MVSTGFDPVCSTNLSDGFLGVRRQVENANEASQVESIDESEACQVTSRRVSRV